MSRGATEIRSSGERRSQEEGVFPILLHCITPMSSPRRPKAPETSDTMRPRCVRYQPKSCPITRSKRTTLPYKVVIQPWSKTGGNHGAPDVSRAHRAPLTQRFFEGLKIIFALMPQGLTSFAPLLPDKKLLPFGRGPPSVGDASARRTTVPNKEPPHVQIIQTPSRPSRHLQRSAADRRPHR